MKSKKEKSSTGSVKGGKQGHADQKQKKKLQNRLSKIESEISDLEKKISNDDIEIAKNFEILQENEQFFKGYQQKKSRVEELMASWEEVQEQIDQI